MIFLAVGVLALAGLVCLGRRPWLARAHGRPISYLMAAAAVGAAVYDAARGGWLGGSILLSAALTLVLSGGRPKRRPADEMALAEAASTLGVPQSASRAEIEAAYRRLMVRVHPDRGGTAALAARLNAARETLLERRR